MTITDFSSGMFLADGKFLETGLYFNGTLDEIIDYLNSFKEKYREYDFLNLENNDGEYCLVGYIRKIKEHDVIVLNVGIPYTELRSGDMGTVIHINNDNTYEIEFIKNDMVSIQRLKPIMFRKK